MSDSAIARFARPRHPDEFSVVSRGGRRMYNFVWNRQRLLVMKNQSRPNRLPGCWWRVIESSLLSLRHTTLPFPPSIHPIPFRCPLIFPSSLHPPVIPPASISHHTSSTHRRSVLSCFRVTFYFKPPHSNYRGLSGYSILWPFVTGRLEAAFNIGISFPSPRSSLPARTW